MIFKFILISTYRQALCFYVYYAKSVFIYVPSGFIAFTFTIQIKICVCFGWQSAQIFCQSDLGQSNFGEFLVMTIDFFGPFFLRSVGRFSGSETPQEIVDLGLTFRRKLRKRDYLLGIPTSHHRGGKDTCEGPTRQEARRASPDSLVERPRSGFTCFLRATLYALHKRSTRVEQESKWISRKAFLRSPCF